MTVPTVGPEHGHSLAVIRRAAGVDVATIARATGTTAGNLRAFEAGRVGLAEPAWLDALSLVGHCLVAAQRVR